MNTPIEFATTPSAVLPPLDKVPTADRSRWLRPAGTRSMSAARPATLRLGVVLAAGCLLGGLKAADHSFHLFQLATLAALGFVLHAGWKDGRSAPRLGEAALACLLAVVASAAAGAVAVIGLRTLDSAAPGLISIRSYVLAGQTCLFAPVLYLVGAAVGRPTASKCAGMNPDL